MDGRRAKWALLPAAISLVAIGSWIPLADPAARLPGLAIPAALMAGYAVLLIYYTAKDPTPSLPWYVRLLVAGFAFMQGWGLVGIGARQAERTGNPLWHGVGTLGLLAILLAGLHLALYRAPPKPEADNRQFKWPAEPDT